MMDLQEGREEEAVVTSTKAVATGSLLPVILLVVFAIALSVTIAVYLLIEGKSPLKGNSIAVILANVAYSERSGTGCVAGLSNLNLVLRRVSPRNNYHLQVGDRESQGVPYEGDAPIEGVANNSQC